jgi:F-type H+-transporting ATPase subunit a
MIGMIPYTFTVTSHLIITFGLGLATFIGITIVALREHKLHFFAFFLPGGAPLAMAPFLVIIEFISYMFRGISLSIRLFANMMAGHTLLKILAGFSWTMLSLGGIFYVLQLFPLLVVFALTGLELGIAFLQAYVWTVLVCIYLNDAIHLH